MTAFSEELDTVAARLQQARAVAAAAGLPVTPQGIDPPPTVILPAEPTTSQQVAAVDAYQGQVRAWNEVNQTVSYARGLELAAHERLAAALREPKSMFESLRENAGFIATGAALGAAGSLHVENSRFRWLSAQHGRESLELTRRIADNPALTQAQRTRLQSARNAIGDRAVRENRIARSQSRLLSGLDRTSGRYLLDVIARSPAEKVQGASVFARTGKVLGKVPYAGVLFTAGQTVWDIRHGKPADRAIGSAVIATGVGAGVTEGMLALAPVALAGGPFTLAAFGVGVAAAWGVGYIVENHWDDIKDFGEDTVGAVGDAVATAGRTVSGRIGRLANPARHELRSPGTAGVIPRPMSGDGRWRHLGRDRCWSGTVTAAVTPMGWLPSCSGSCSPP
jgi:hypothetical protein